VSAHVAAPSAIALVARAPALVVPSRRSRRRTSAPSPIATIPSGGQAMLSSATTKAIVPSLARGVSLKAVTGW